MEAVTGKLADFVTETQFEDLPQKVVHEAKRILLDAFGCALAGIATDKGKFSIQLARRLGGSPESTILGLGDRVSCTSAAFANGELINALDMDSLLIPEGHVSPFVTPAALAIAESVKSSGKEFLLATALSHEISCRLGGSLRGLFKAVKEGSERKVVFSEVHGYSWCIFGGTAGAGKILKLNNEKMSHALGIAGHICPVPGMTKWANTAPLAMTKYLSAGWVSQAEVTAALLAEMGYTGDTTVLDGEHGFWKFFCSDKWKPDELTGKLGEEWHLLAISYKPYPCFRPVHGPLDSFIKIINENELMPRDIEKVRVELGSLSLANLPAGRNQQIKTHIDAQFSVAYIFAVAAHRIKSGADWQDLHTMTSPEIREFMNKVSFDTPPGFSKRMLEDPRNVTSSVEVVAKGKTFRQEKAWSKGSPDPEEARMTDEELVDKFKNNACRILTRDKMDSAVKTIFQLEAVEDISKLVKYLSL